LVGHWSADLPLTQCKRDQADADQRKQDERTSKKMRLNECVGLFFHFFGSFDFLNLRRQYASLLLGSPVFTNKQGAESRLFLQIF
jgi:hypothetical protein